VQFLVMAALIQNTQHFSNVLLQFNPVIEITPPNIFLCKRVLFSVGRNYFCYGVVHSGSFYLDS